MIGLISLLTITNSTNRGYIYIYVYSSPTLLVTLLNPFPSLVWGARQKQGEGEGEEKEEEEEEEEEEEGEEEEGEKSKR